MKNRKIIVFVFCTFFCLGQLVSQEIYIKVTYKKKSTIVLKNNNKKNEINGILRKSQENMSKLEYNLIFDNRSSLFKEVSKMNIDDNKNALATKLSRMFGDTQGVFFTDRETGKTIHQKEFESEFFLIEHEKINDWVLTQEKKKIGNYICYKAIKNDAYINSSGEKKYFNVIAWYTQELPYPYGPTTYNSLPGVILELINRQVNIYASKIELNPKQRRSITVPKEGVNVTNVKYDSIISGLATDFRKKYKRN